MARCDPDTCITNSLHHNTQFDLPVREELVTVCMGRVNFRPLIKGVVLPLAIVEKG